jgi:flagellar basal body-associated protein FliL
MDWIRILIEVIVAIMAAGGFWSFLQYRSSKKSLEALTNAQAREAEAKAVLLEVDASGRIQGIVFAMIEPMQKELVKQGKEINDLRMLLSKYAERIAVLMDGIGLLIKQITDHLNAIPCWTPEEWHPDNEGKG